jgi:hypothetical protein
MLVFSDPAGRYPIARLFPREGVSARWQWLPAPGGGFGRIEIDDGIQLSGFARLDAWRYWTARDEAFEGDHVVVPAYARARLLGAAGADHVRVRVETGLTSPSTLELTVPCADLASRYPGPRVDLDLDELLRLSRALDAENPGPWVAPAGDRVDLAAGPGGPPLFTLAPLPGARETFTRLEERAGFIHVRIRKDEVALDGWAPASQLVDAPSSSVRRSLLGFGSGMGCSLWRSSVAAAILRDTEVRIGADPTHARSVGVIVKGATGYVEERSGAFIALTFHNGLDAPEEMRFWARAADVQNVEP